MSLSRTLFRKCVRESSLLLIHELCFTKKLEVMDYIVKISEDIITKEILKNTPSSLLNDVLVAVAKKEGGDRWS